MNGKKKKKQNIFYAVLGVLFLLVVFGFTLAGLILPDKAYSADEKRNLAQVPAVSVDRLTTGDFMKDTEKYMADQFPGRDLWMKLRTQVDTLWGQNESQGVYRCDYGFMAEPFRELSKENTQETLVQLKTFAQKYEQSHVMMMVVPTLVSVRPEILPKDAPTENQNAYIDSWYETLGDSMETIDVREVFAKNKERMQLYYHTDHHWTTDAAYLAYQKLAQARSFEEDVTYNSGVICNSFVGSLAAKSGFMPKMADIITAYVPEQEVPVAVLYEQEEQQTSGCYQTERLQGDDPYQVFFGGNHSVIQIQTGLNTGRTLLVVKDSYANCFIPFLTQHYDQITVVDPRYYAEDIDMLMLSSMTGYSDVLFLYNANTLAQDTSLKTMLQNRQ